MRQFVFIATILFFWTFSSAAQSLVANADSLYKLGALNQAISLYEQCLQQERVLENPDYKLIAGILSSLGAACEDAGRLDEALKWYELFQKVALVVKPDDVVDSYNLIGNVWFRKGRFNQAIDNYFKALYYCFQNNDIGSAASAMNNIGNVYFSLDEYEKALEYYQRAIILMRRQGMREDLAASLINSGNVYLLLEDFSKARSCFTDAYRIAVETGNGMRQGSALTSLGIYYEKTNNIDSAAWYFSQTMAIVDTTQSSVEYLMTIRGLGSVEMKRGNNQLAADYLDKAYRLANDAGLTDVATDILNLLIQVSEKLYNPLKTIEYYRSFVDLSKQVSQAEVSEKMAKYEQSYKTLLKEKTIEAQKKEIAAVQQANRFLTWLFIAVFVFSLVLFFVFRRLYINRSRIQQHKLESRLIEIRLQALSAQINPHFVSNALNSIQSYFIKGDIEKASDYLADFGMLIRMVLDNSVKNFIPISEEMQFLSLYLKLEQLRMSHKFAFNISCDPLLSDPEVLIPPLLIQPYVENAIWHGISNKDGYGEIDVHFGLNGNQLMVTVCDDGIGVEQSKKLQTQFPRKRKSYAMSINRDRIKLLGDFFKRQVAVSVAPFDKNKNTGTQVELIIPVIFEQQK